MYYFIMKIKLYSSYISTAICTKYSAFRRILDNVNQLDQTKDTLDCVTCGVFDLRLKCKKTVT